MPTTQARVAVASCKHQCSCKQVVARHTKKSMSCMVMFSSWQESLFICCPNAVTHEALNINTTQHDKRASGDEKPPENRERQAQPDANDQKLSQTNRLSVHNPISLRLDRTSRLSRHAGFQNVAGSSTLSPYIKAVIEPRRVANIAYSNLESFLGRICESNSRGTLAVMGFLGGQDFTKRKHFPRKHRLDSNSAND